ncbi:MAG: L,D-transpeptidase [Gemmatimonadetes bacterium]|nr:L,D-transpeptidase [Gemmatimonadota bacterium]
MTRQRSIIRLLPLALLAGAAPVAGQGVLEFNGSPLVYEDRILERELDAGAPLVPSNDRYVVVHLAENRVFVFEGEEAIWSAPAGTGTGFQLETSTHNWTFTTPRGYFKIARMEKDPVWQAPDWWYAENGLAIPSYDHPSRFKPGAMGNSAVYLGDGIAIHGTQFPQQLLNPDPEARRISHGCIRLTNESARELMHLVDVGATVLVY